MADESATSSGEEYVASPPKASKVKEISAKGQKAAPKLVVNQNATKHALLADETATTSGEEYVALPPKASKVKEISAKGQKAAPKLVVNQNATKHALLVDETATTSGEEYVASPPKASKVKEISAKGQKAAPKLVVNQNATNVHYWLMKQPPHQVRNMLLHPQKHLKSKKYLQRAKKLHQNWLLKKGNTQKGINIV